MSVDVEAWYQRYGPMVLRRCRAILKDEERAVEAMQDVFVELVRRQDRMHDAAPSSLLYRMATNTCLNHLRSRRRRPETLDNDLLARIAQAPTGEDRTVARDLLDVVFRREKASTRTIAVLYLLDGMTLQEVADTVGLSVSGVRKRLRTMQGRIAELEGV